MDVVELHRRAVESCGQRVRAVRDDQWALPTPCADWDVRALVNHLVGESLWTAPLLDGATIADVGDRFDGDVLGADPVAAWDRSAADALAAAARDRAADGLVHLSYGEERAEEYLRQLSADYLVHGWDVARATGGDEALDPDLVADVGTWFAGVEEAYRSGGVIGPRIEVPPDAGPQERLLAAFGRTP